MTTYKCLVTETEVVELIKQGSEFFDKNFRYDVKALEAFTDSDDPKEIAQSCFAFGFAVGAKVGAKHD